MNDENLKPLNKRTKNEQREIAKNGGVASGEARKEKKKLKDTLKALLELKDDNSENYQFKLCLALFEKACKGDVQAFITIRDTIGEKPVDKVETNNPPQPLTPEQRKQIAIDFGFE